MTVNALYPDYQGNVRDAESNFHGGRIVYISWDRHLMFTNPYAFLVQPEMKFGDFINTMMASAYASHPDWEKINWAEVVWYRGGTMFKPDPAATFAENGVGHKTALRFSTPGLDGIEGLGI